MLAHLAHAVTIPTVPVGNPGNPADTRYVATGIGSISYNYRIGTTEVTNAQYVEFLNVIDPTGANILRLYTSEMTSSVLGGINFTGGADNGSKYGIKTGRDNNPVAFVSWYDSIRFANWLHNGQGTGDTENGAYTLLGGTPTPINGDSITRNPGSKWWLPNEDEWYKAAYHKNDGVTGNYWDYPSSMDAVPYSDQPPGSDAPTQSNTGNFYNDDGIVNGYDDGYAVTGSPTLEDSQNHLTDVGAYTLSTSPYGTFDQGGNLFEWTETLISPSTRVIRGSEWGSDANAQHASQQFIDDSTSERADVGFRVASIPEPSTLLLGAMAGLGILWPQRPPARDFRRVISVCQRAIVAAYATPPGLSPHFPYRALAAYRWRLCSSDNSRTHQSNLLILPISVS
jgi:formylglycine-generating enzyme required for sulfatase activity